MAGGSDQWSGWFDQHGAALVLFARQWVASRPDAEDVVQEAFVRFWRSRQRAMGPAAYLYTCVKHCALDWLRGRQQQSRREQAVLSHVLLQEGRTAAEQALRDVLALDPSHAEAKHNLAVLVGQEDTPKPLGR